MRFRYTFSNLLFFFFSSAFAQTPGALISSDSVDQKSSYFGAGTPSSGGGVLFRTGNAPGNPSLKTFPPGSTVVSIVKGDSTLQTFHLSADDEVNVIVEFTNAPLSTIHSVRDKVPAARLQSALSATRGEHDRFKADLPRIESSPPSRARTTFAANPSAIRYEYWIALNGVALTTHRWVLDEIWKLPYVTNVSEDNVARVFDDPTNALIGAPQLWSAYNIHADSVGIGIIDTGIDYLHEALGGAAFPNSKVVGGYDFVNLDNDPMDDHGHGTHVAGIAAGDGPPPTNLRGVAYGARLWAFKVLDASGKGLFSQVIAGLDRALDPDSDPATPTPISVVNLSIGGSGNPNDPLSRAIDNAVTSGVVCAVAAGNSGSGYYTINSPGGARKALTVGAVSNSDVIAFFSSRGPSSTLFAIKPDLLAPGYPVKSAKAGGGYVLMSGTSMATPHVAGAAALIRQLHPTWTAEEIKANLMETSQDLSLDVWTQGSGRINVFHAAQESVVVTPGSLSFGFDVTSQTTWSQRETLTIYNSKSVQEIFQFSTASAPPSGITVSFDSLFLVVNAHDSSSVGITLTVNNSVYGFPTSNPPAYSNRVIMQSTLTSEMLSLPLAFIKSPIFNLTFDVAPTLVDIHNNNDTAFFNLVFSNLIGRGLSLLVPVDTYDVATFFYVDSQMVVTEGIKVNGVKSVTINSRDARNAMTIKPLDNNGHEITVRRLELESIVSKRSRFGISLFGELTHKKRFISDMSSDYLYELSTIPDFPLVNNVLYVYPFVVSGGITGPVTLQNDPAAFKRVDYRFSVPPLTTRLYLSTIFSTTTFGLGTTLGTVSPPFWMTAFYLPSPTGENFPYTTHWMTRNTLDILGNLLHRTGYVSVTEPDTLKFSLSPSGYHFGSAGFVSTRPAFTDPLGVTPPMWGGKLFNLGGQFDAQVATDFYFNTTVGDRSVGPISYQLYSNGALLSSGIMQNHPYYLDTLFDVPNGQYEFDASFSSFKVGPRQAIAKARITGDANNIGTVCPRFRRMQFLRDGELPDSLPANQLVIVPNAVHGLDSLTVFYRKSTDSVWIPLATTRHDSTHVAALPQSLDVGYFSTRVRVTDLLHFVNDYTLDPGFAVPGTILDTASLLYDTTRIGCRQTKYIGVQNLRLMTNAYVTSIVSDDSNFVLTGTHGGSIAGSESLNCPVTFAPRSAGEKHGHIIFIIAGIADPETVLVSGVGGSTGSEISVSATLGLRWQLISVPVNTQCPYLMGPLFWYHGTYFVRDTLKPGEGYWKILSDSVLTFGGLPVTVDTMPVLQGWNLIGSISVPAPTTALSSIPDGMISSRVFGYSGSGYTRPDSILPSHGYWVKVRGNCNLVLRNSTSFVAMAAHSDPYTTASHLTITDATHRSRTLYFGPKGDLPKNQGLFELPPVPPEGAFDVRFATNRECEVVGDRRAQTLPIHIRSAEYPVTISWELKSRQVLAFLGVGGASLELSGTGSTELTSATDTVVLRVSGSSAIPTTFALDPNYPNPFNPQTVIQYQLPVDSRVDLKIFSGLGQEVAILAHGEEPAGYKSVTWNGINFASGVYFCRLQAVNLADPSRTFTQVRKLVLVR